jgi:hypothetical protein
LTFFPNPVSNILTINLENLNEPSVISIYSQNGILLKQLLADKGMDVIQLDVQDLQTGFYILNIKNEKRNI